MKSKAQEKPGPAAPETPSGEAHLTRLLEELARAEAFPQGAGPVEIRQTHISCVFLVGDFAYKLKKPVDFGFLDYRTRAAREAFCRREVVLNARLCPEVYLDVVPVVEAGGRWRVGAEGEGYPVVDWAVRMRRLPEDRMLAGRLPELTDLDARRLARPIAAFHARAETSPEIAAYGEPGMLRANADENFAVMAGLPAEVLSPVSLAALRRFTEQTLETHADRFARRVAAGRVRDGHGDLRLRNICLAPGIQGGVQIFDCIEFNDRFRYQDVAADLAYLAMDFDLAARRDLREALVEEYVAESGDADLHAVLPFYLCYRACVRGKIATLAAEEPEIAAEERLAHREMAQAAFDLACAYAGDAERGAELWVMVGYSGSGKSRLACELARRLPAVRLSSDRVRKERAAVPAGARLEDAAYAPAARREVYDALFRRAEAWLRKGVSVVLDATFLDPAERARAAETAAACERPLRVVVCRCPEAVIRERLSGRTAETASASDAGPEVFEAQRARWRLPEGGAAGVTEVDTSRPAAAVAREVVEAR